MGAFFAIHQGNNPKVTGFIAFWLLMAGYASKEVWDEPRNRAAEWMQGLRPKAVPACPSEAGPGHEVMIDMNTGAHS